MSCQKDLRKILNLCKNRGFVFQGSEIYGGIANMWDYGPIGIELKNNIKKIWRDKFIRKNELNVGFDAAILMNPTVWEASGHVQNFTDPLTDCKNCKVRLRADKLIEHSEDMNFSQIYENIKKNNVKCPQCGATDFTPVRNFNLMFKTSQSITGKENSDIYLRPETAQGIFVNFNNVLRSTRKKIPFGIGQVGKAFRNEITPGNFLFRVREFEQMELEFFCKPGTDDHWFEFWRTFCYNWLVELGFQAENLRFRDHEKNELSHYSKNTTDIEFSFPFGWGELWGIANRGDFDLSTHHKHSGKTFEYFDAESGQKFVPYCVESSVGLDRVLLALLYDSYDEEKINEKDSRTVLRFNYSVAPYKACVLPISKELDKNAHEIYELLLKNIFIDYDKSGSIGKRYRRQDEIGTPFCITYDFNSPTDNKVTIRNRDTMIQDRIEITNILNYIKDHVVF
ncbi:MAG: glycine--tRNA ligase [Candidatus Improbicoccus devescovinae]|nr:MAG: glycine--tRNA ligase [Candidatus Improbicoccus devescovinae]